MDALRIGLTLRAVRRHLNLTQAAVARRAGISQSVYSRAERGVSAVLAWHARHRTLLIVEVKSRFTDLEAMLLSLALKLRVVPDEARVERGWDAVNVARVVVTYGSAESRAVVTRHASIFDVSLPARAAEIRSWLRDPKRPLSGVWLLSPDVVSLPGRRHRRTG
jgi:Helix-turn-helix